SVSIPLTEKQAYYPVTSAQKRIYVVQQLDKGGISYNIPHILQLQGKVDLTKLEAAFQEIVKRHEAFRTSFHTVEDELVQSIHEDVALSIEYSKKAPEVSIDTMIKNFIRPFHLSEAPLLRVGVVTISEDVHFLMWDMHHIISDGISVGLFMKEFEALYKGHTLSSVPIQYKDYAAWQQTQTASETYKKQEAYWLNRLDGELPILDLPTDYSRPKVQHFTGSRTGFEVGQELTKKLKHLSTQQGTTLYMTLLGAYHILLSKYSGQQDIIVGSPIGGRSHAETESIIGMFVNTVAIRNQVQPTSSFDEWIQQVKERVLEAYEHQAYPLEVLIEKLGIPRELDRNPIFDTAFSLQNIDQSNISLPNVQVQPYNYLFEVSKFDLTFQAVEANHTILFDCEYSTHLFNAQTVKRMGLHYIQILESIVENPQILLSEIELVTKEEKKELLDEFNDTTTAYESQVCVHHLFEDQVTKTPHAVAVMYEGETLTYETLNQRATQLAQALRAKGIGPGKIVGLMMKRSLDMFVGIVGVLKAGGAYLSLDPSHPDERLQFIIEDSGLDLVVVHDQVSYETFTAPGIMNINSPNNYAIERSLAIGTPTPTDLAYIIYTSGSTGQPKGVMVEHRSLVNLVEWHQKEFQITSRDRSTQFASV
ncbi:non-ribosomal peptide synthetase, partial [Priestia aryabhattai]|uniref:non-ribosomal peptide synthetase n=1 Tax=Priestia aryabhattai TaxID=412384 RepID=UPI001CFF2895